MSLSDLKADLVTQALCPGWYLDSSRLVIRYWADGVAVFHLESGDIYVLSALCGGLLSEMDSVNGVLRLSGELVERLSQNYTGAPQGEDLGQLVLASLESMERLAIIKRVV